MTRSLLVPVAAVILAVVVLARVASSQDASPATLPSAGDVDPAMIVAQLEADLAHAMLTADAAFFERHLADDFRNVNAAGAVEGKAQYVADLRSGAFRCTAHKLAAPHTQRVADDVVLFSARVDQAYTWQGQPGTGTYQMTSLWTRRAGQWVCVAQQWTMVRPPE
jgi:hypothetical protein